MVRGLITTGTARRPFLTLTYKEIHKMPKYKITPEAKLTEITIQLLELWQELPNRITKQASLYTLYDVAILILQHILKILKQKP